MYRPKSTLEQWRIFQALVDHGGYAQAAKILNKSQSSLNHAVAKLQQGLGIALLEGKGRKAYLTPINTRHNYDLDSELELVLAEGKEAEQGWERTKQR